MDLHETVSRALWSSLPTDQIDRVMATDASCEINPEFLGFVTIYRNLAEVIPRHYTVVDLGCAYAPQSWYFRDHKAYVGVDIMTDVRFATPNTIHHKSTIGEFIDAECPQLDLDTTFGICSYVPPWGADNGALTRATFRHCFVFYPCGGRTIKMGA